MSKGKPRRVNSSAADDPTPCHCLMAVRRFCCTAANTRTRHSVHDAQFGNETFRFWGAAMDAVADIKASSPSRAGRPRSEGCRRKILAAADALLARHGFAGTSVDAIAQAAGVSK